MGDAPDQPWGDTGNTAQHDGGTGFGYGAVGELDGGNNNALPQLPFLGQLSSAVILFDHELAQVGFVGGGIPTRSCTH